MNKTTEALKLADKVISRYRNETPIGNQPHMICHIADEALAAIREAKAELEKQEPVAWAYIDADGSFMDALDRQHGAYQTPLYAAPVSAKREWVDLTDDEEYELAKQSEGKSRHWLVGSAIAAFKEKNK